MKPYPTIGCCGIDCGLCPRYYTAGPSACPGCGGPDFREKHPSCGILTCCVRKHGLEICALCAEYPCARFEPQKINRDSFVTHQKIFANHDRIREKGLEHFLGLQEQRMQVLRELLDHFDDVRSKSFFCLACTLLPAEALNETLRSVRISTKNMSRKEQNKIIKEKLRDIATDCRIDLELKQS
jgi:hypothetical protein